jgi:hypothetical protein
MQSFKSCKPERNQFNLVFIDAILSSSIGISAISTATQTQWVALRLG